MSYYISKKSAQESFPMQIKAYNAAIEALEKLGEVAEAWDGKVINKRFTEALNAMVPFASFYLSKSEAGYPTRVWQDIKVYLRRNEFNYMTGETEFKLYTYYSNDDCYITQNDKGSWRLNAAKLRDAVSKGIEGIRRKIEEYQYCLDNYDKIHHQYVEMRKRLDEMRESIPYPLKPKTYSIEGPVYDR